MVAVVVGEITGLIVEDDHNFGLGELSCCVGDARSAVDEFAERFGCGLCS